MNNFIQIIGRLTKDVEVRYTSNSKPVADFNLAVNREYKNQNGEYETDFIPVVMWGKKSEVLKEYSKKGDLIAIAGRLQIDKYTNDKGENRYKTFVNASNMTFLKRKEDFTEVEENNPFEEFGEHFKTESQIGYQMDIDDSELPF